MIPYQAAGLAPGMMMIRRPAIQLGALHHAGRHEARLVAALKQCAAAPVLFIRIQHIQPADMLHEPRDGGYIIGRHEQMDMIGHQHIGVQRNAATPARGIRDRTGGHHPKRSRRCGCGRVAPHAPGYPADTSVSCEAWQLLCQRREGCGRIVKT